MKRMQKTKLAMLAMLALFLFACCILSFATQDPPDDPNTARLLRQYSGSRSCRPCHERFYELWATSHHGLAMQPYTPQLAAKELLPQTEPVQIGPYQFQADRDENAGWILEKGPQGEKKYPIEHVMGGKNVYFFLTPLDRGRLQVLPVSYDVRKKEWYNTTSSMVRHFTDITDQEIDWKDPMLTFNAACFSCHVSQLSTNYDFSTDSYNTVWAEPGINCETCHGPAQEHIRICVLAEANKTPLPKDLKMPVIMQKAGYTAHQVDTACSLCHTKGAALTTTYRPGDDYFDHYDLVTFEDPDFYPDGRDLGENYTYTLWRMAPCIKEGKLDCTFCHTSSGRFRFKDNPNQACAPCHDDHVKNPTAHTHHKKDSKGNQCVSCHMPMTDFARMRRSDHSLRPPMPAATKAFSSPNACTICHTKKDADWADRHVRKWRNRDYQQPVLHVGGLILAARRGDWIRLPEMLEYIQRRDRNEIFANSLVRLLRNCSDARKWPVLKRLTEEDPSPLVRSSAVEALSDWSAPEARAALLNAARDPVRIVRIRAGSGLVPRFDTLSDPNDRRAAQHALDEYLATMKVRPDNWTAHYNMGNYYMARGRHDDAVEAYKTAQKFRPDIIQPLVNLAFAYNLTGKNQPAEKALRDALKIDPQNPLINLNLGLLLGETGKISQARQYFHKAFEINPASSVAAYNLGVIYGSQNQLAEALAWAQKARQLEPANDKYAYTHAFYLARLGNADQAVEILRPMAEANTDFPDVFYLLVALYEQKRDINGALDTCSRVMNNPNLNPQIRQHFQQRSEDLKSGQF